MIVVVVFQGERGIPSDGAADGTNGIPDGGDAVFDAASGSQRSGHQTPAAHASPN